MSSGFHGDSVIMLIPFWLMVPCRRLYFWYLRDCCCCYFQGQNITP